MKSPGTVYVNSNMVLPTTINNNVLIYLQDPGNSTPYTVTLPSSVVSRTGMQLYFTNWSGLTINLFDSINNTTFLCKENLILQSNSVGWIVILDTNKTTTLQGQITNNKTNVDDIVSAYGLHKTQKNITVNDLTCNSGNFYFNNNYGTIFSKSGFNLGLLKTNSTTDYYSSVTVENTATIISATIQEDLLCYYCLRIYPVLLPFFILHKIICSTQVIATPILVFTYNI